MPKRRSQRPNTNNNRANVQKEVETIKKNDKFKKVELKALNKNQEKYINAIENSVLTVVLGIAGSGKSFIPSIIAADMFSNREINSIILARPTEGPSKPLGTLPGTINEKLQSWLTPLVQTIKKRLGPGNFDYHLGKGNIELLPLAQVKGRTFEDTFVIIDEAEDIDIETMKSLVTRIGKNSKIVINGDIKQKHIKQKSGLEYLLYLIKKYSLPISIIEFEIDDCVRSKTTKMFLRCFEAEEDEKS